MSSSAIRAGRAFVELFADDSALVRTLRRAEAKVVQFGTNIQSIGRRLTMLGLSASIPFAASMRVFSSFDDQMRTVQAVTGATGAEFDKLTEKAKLLGRTTSFTTAQVASGMVELGRAGFAPDEVDTAIAGMLDLARATGTDLAIATEIAGNTLRRFNLDANEMTRVSDVLTATANLSAQTLVDLGESLKDSGPLASAYGMSLEELCKTLGALANFGIKGSMAGTTMKNIMTRLADPKIQKQFDELGVSVSKMGKMRNVADILSDVGKAVESLPTDKKLAIFKDLFGLRAIAGGAKLTVAEFKRLNDGIDASAGRSRQTAKDMDAGIGGSFRMLWSAIEGVAIAVGEALAPSLQKLTDYFTAATSGLVEYITKNKELIVRSAKIVSIITGIGIGLLALGGMFIGVGKTIGIIATSIASVANIALAGISLISGAVNVLTFIIGGIAIAFTTVVSGLGVVFGGITSALTAALSGLAVIGTTVFSAIAAMVAALVSPIGLVVIALAAVGGAAYLVEQNFSAISNIVAAVFNGIVSAIRNVLTAVYAFLNQFVEFKILFTVVQLAVSGIKILGQTFLWLGQNIAVPVIRSIANIFVWLGRQVVNIGAGIVSSIVSVFSRIAGFIGTVFGGMISIVRNIFTNIVAVSGSVFSTIGQVLSPILTIVSTVFHGAVRMMSGFISVLKNVAGWVGALARSFFVVEAGVQVFSLLSRAVSGLVGLFATAARGIIATLFTIVQNIPAIVAGIVRFFAAVPGFILSAFRAVPQIIGGVFAAAFSIVRNVISGIGNVLSGVVSLMSGMWNGLTGVFSKVFETLGSIVSGFGNFFIGAFANVGTAVNWLREMFGSLCSFATETFGAITAALGRGDIEAAIQVIWASIKLIWVKGSTSLLSTWYWLTETLQTAWANCVFKIAELLTAAWFGVQEFWTETVYTMSTLWVEFSNGVVSAWKTAEQSIAQGIGYIIAKMQGLDPNEMANIISEDYNRQAQQRENEKSNALSSIQQQRDNKMSSLKTEKEGTLNALQSDFERNSENRRTDYDAKIAAQEAELQSAKNAYNEAINNAKNPVKPEGAEEPESLTDRLKAKVEETIKGFKANTDLDSKVSVSGSFSAAAIQSMGYGSSMDRVAKATEKSEKHLEKLVNKNDKPDKQPTKQQDEDEDYDGDDLAVRELKQQTRFLRDISERGLSSKFA
ncbi:MAG: phage tail tape measure protein [Planctomycetaceae bacterium]|jgi:TP901 family phage tail tape measure protein|nr:phage tail tape measure protein [Planctomycetaceae bacterium]